MSDFVANADLTVDYAAGSPVSGGVQAVTPTLITKAKVGGKPVHAGGVTVSYTLAVGGGSVNLVGTGVIEPTAEKGKAEGSRMNRVGDSVTITFTGTQTAPPNNPVSIDADVEITDAGQTVVKCN